MQFCNSVDRTAIRGALARFDVPETSRSKTSASGMTGPCAMQASTMMGNHWVPNYRSVSIIIPITNSCSMPQGCGGV